MRKKIAREAEKNLKDGTHLCGNCHYCAGDCKGKPIFAGELDKTLTRPEIDRVVYCKKFEWDDS